MHHIKANGTTPNGYPEKSGLPFDTALPPGMTESDQMPNGNALKEDMMNNFHAKIGQDMDLNLPPYQKSTFANGDVSHDAETIDVNDYGMDGNYVNMDSNRDLLDEKHHEEVYYYPVDEVIVEDCCPAVVYRKMPCCNGETAPFWQVWNKHRLLGSK